MLLLVAWSDGVMECVQVDKFPLGGAIMAWLNDRRLIRTPLPSKFQTKERAQTRIPAQAYTSTSIIYQCKSVGKIFKNERRKLDNKNNVRTGSRCIGLPNRRRVASRYG